MNRLKKKNESIIYLTDFKCIFCDFQRENVTFGLEPEIERERERERERARESERERERHKEEDHTEREIMTEEMRRNRDSKS